jgi:hypothetical protein
MGYWIGSEVSVYNIMYRIRCNNVNFHFDIALMNFYPYLCF